MSSPRVNAGGVKDLVRDGSGRELHKSSCVTPIGSFKTEKSFVLPASKKKEVELVKYMEKLKVFFAGRVRG